jgi:hypothetical protein
MLSFKKQKKIIRKRSRIRFGAETRMDPDSDTEHKK